MLKVLVADENIEETKNCYQYLANKNALLIICVNTGIDTINKYNELKPHILILNSHFSDINSIEIIDRLSKTIIEKKNTNIILTTNTEKEQLLFTDIAKIYKFIKKSINYKELYDTINRMKLENKYDEFDIKYLNTLLFSMKIIIASPRTELLKEAIIECYHNPVLTGNLDALLRLLSYKHNGLDIEAIRSAIRDSLKPVNNYREELQEHPVVKMFDPSKNISPRHFLETIIAYLYIKKNQEIDF